MGFIIGRTLQLPIGPRTLLYVGGPNAGVLHELVADPGELTAAELYDRYVTELLAVIDEHGLETVAERANVERSKLRALSKGEGSDLTLEEAAEVFALSAEPDGETIALLARDELLMGMTTAVLDVEAVESGLNGELEAREIQSKIEGRYPMTLREFALLYGYIDGAR